MAKNFIDLGEDCGDICAPSNGDKKYYPSFSIDSDAPAGLKVGDEGTATIKFKVCSRNENESAGDEGVKKSMQFDITAVAFDGKKQSSEPKERDDMDAIKKGLDDENDEEE